MEPNYQFEIIANYFFCEETRPKWLGSTISIILRSVSNSKTLCIAQSIRFQRKWPCNTRKTDLHLKDYVTGTEL